MRPVKELALQVAEEVDPHKAWNGFQLHALSCALEDARHEGGREMEAKLRPDLERAEAAARGAVTTALAAERRSWVLFWLVAAAALAAIVRAFWVVASQ